MFRLSAKPLCGRYLSFAEREEIALLRVQGCSMREVAHRLGRTASTISRELRRNAATQSGGLEYRATTAQWHVDRSARRPKQAKLALNAALRTYVEERLAGFVVARSAPGQRPRAHPAARSVALKDQNKLAGGVPKDMPFQRLRRPNELNLKTEITASQFCAVIVRFGVDFNSNQRFFSTPE